MPPPPSTPELDPHRFPVHAASPRGFRQAFVHEGLGGVPLLCVHGWPETKRIFWKVIEPLAAAGFEVIVPDLRGFGDSDVGPDGFHDVAVARSRPLRAGARPARSRARRRARRRPGRPGHPGPRAPPPRVGGPHGAVQLAPALRQGAHGGDAHPAGSGGQRLLRAPGHRRRRTGRRAADARRAPSLHRHLLHVEVLGPPRRVRRPTDARPDAHGSAARQPSTSTPSPSATPPSCERRSAPTRARSTRRHASRRLASGATSGPGR